MSSKGKKPTEDNLNGFKIVKAGDTEIKVYNDLPDWFREKLTAVESVLKKPAFSVPAYFTSTKIGSRYADAINIYNSCYPVAQAIDFLTSLILRAISSDSVSNEKLKVVLSDKDFRKSVQAAATSYYINGVVYAIIDYKKSRLSKKTVYTPVLFIIPPQNVVVFGVPGNYYYGIVYDSQTISRYNDWVKKGNKSKYADFIKAAGLDQIILRQATRTDFETIPTALRGMIEASETNTLIVNPDRFFAAVSPSFSRYPEPKLSRLVDIVNLYNAVLDAYKTFYEAATVMFVTVKMDGTAKERKDIVDRITTLVRDQKSRVVIIGLPETTNLEFASGWRQMPSDIEDFLNGINTYIIKMILGTGIEKDYDELMKSVYNRVNEFCEVLNELINLAAERNSVMPETMSELRVLISPVELDVLVKLRREGVISASTVLDAIGSNVDAELNKREYEKQVGFDTKMMPEFQPFQGKYSVISNKEETPKEESQEPEGEPSD